MTEAEPVAKEDEEKPVQVEKEAEPEPESMFFSLKFKIFLNFGPVFFMWKFSFFTSIWRAMLTFLMKDYEKNFLTSDPIFWEIRRKKNSNSWFCFFDL